MFLSLHLASASLPSSIFVYRSLPLGGSINQPGKPNPAGWGWTISLSSGPTSPFRLSLSHFLYLTRILWSLWLVLRRPLCLLLDVSLLPTPTAFLHSQGRQGELMRSTCWGWGRGTGTQLLEYLIAKSSPRARHLEVSCERASWAGIGPLLQPAPYMKSLSQVARPKEWTLALIHLLSTLVSDPICLLANYFVCLQAMPASEGQMTACFELVLSASECWDPNSHGQVCGKCFTFEAIPHTLVLFHEMASRAALAN